MQTARCWVAGRWVTLGKHDFPESRAEYAHLLAEPAVAPAPAAVATVGTPDVTVNELLVGFGRFAEEHYRHHDGTPTNELPQFRQTFRLMGELYGHTPAKEFGPLAFKAMRQKMIESGWNRKLVNRRVGRVRRVFRWAAENELIPAAVHQELATVVGLQPGRTQARELDPVEPVAEEHVRPEDAPVSVARGSEPAKQAGAGHAERYYVTSYGQAVRRAVDRANRAGER